MKNILVLLSAFYIGPVVQIYAAPPSQEVKSLPNEIWSGYVVTAAKGSTGSVTDVKGAWLVPQGTCSAGHPSTALFWVGMDGYNEKPINQIEQIGTFLDCNGSSTPVYGAWYEFGDTRVNLDPKKFPVAANDEISADVSYNAGTMTFTATITDINNHNKMSFPSPPGYMASESSAEWIAEAPYSSLFTDFGALTFISCYATVSGHTGPIRYFDSPPTTVYKLTLTAILDDLTLAIPSSLPVKGSTYPAGSSFVVTATPSLVAYWPAEGSNSCVHAGCPGFQDVFSGNNGTPMGGVTFAPGEFGQAFSFDGTGDVTFGSVGDFGTSDFTMDFWLNTTAVHTDGLLGKRDACTYAQFYETRTLGPFDEGGGHTGQMLVELDGGDSASYEKIISTRLVNDGLFHHIAVVRQGTTASLYIDGAFDSSTSTAAVINVSNFASLSAGESACNGGGDNQPLTGQLDEIQLFSRALSASEIQAIHNAEKGGYSTN